MTLEAKILKALSHAVEAGDIYMRASGEAAFRLNGARNFIENLNSLCTKAERSELKADWVDNDASEGMEADFFAQMVAIAPVNYMKSHMEILAEKILTHYSTEADQMLSAKARVNPFEEDRTFDSDFNKVFKTGEAA